MSLVVTERHGAVITMRVTSVSDTAPENFLTTPVMVQLWDALTTIERDRGIRAVVLTGAQPGRFIGHYDIDEILTSAERVSLPMPRWLAPLVLRTLAPWVRRRGLRELLDRSPVAGVASLLRFHQVVRRIRNSEKVFVAAIDGPAFGGGLELALACDIRVMGDGSYELGLVEALLGLVPGGGGSQLLVRALGTSRTIELLLEGRLLTPRQALDIGLVQHVVPHDAVVDQARQLAQRLARRSPAAVRAIKKAVYGAGSAGVERGLAVERGRFMALASRPPAKTALRHYATQVAHHRMAGDDPADFTRKHLPEWQEGTAVELADEK